jgi:hypothetical protein
MADLLTTAVAIVVLFAFSRLLGPVRRTTAIVLAMLAAASLWANLRASGWQEVLNQVTPHENLDPFTQALFWRGWPVAPVMLCVIHGNRLRPNGAEALAIVFNWLVLFFILALAKLLCERCFGRRQ